MYFLGSQFRLAANAGTQSLSAQYLSAVTRTYIPAFCIFPASGKDSAIVVHLQIGSSINGE
jgi:hypothetical protein